MQTASGLKKAKVPKVHLVALFFGLRRKEKETVRRVPGLAAFFWRFLTNVMPRWRAAHFNAHCYCHAHSSVHSVGEGGGRKRQRQRRRKGAWATAEPP